MSYTIHTGDCVEVMRSMDEGSIHAIVTDPPYGLEFMGKEWDRLIDKRSGDGARMENSGGGGRTTDPYIQSRVTYQGGATAQDWHHAWAVEALRVLKPGGHLLAFGGTRTHHRLMCALEDAGFEIRDTILDLIALDPVVRQFIESLDDSQRGAFFEILNLSGSDGVLAWLYGSGFPKSLDVSKAIDNAAGAEREVIGTRNQRFGLTQARGWNETNTPRNSELTDTAPATDAAKEWDGWGTALKPAWEPIIVARKPLIGTVAENVQKFGTGGLNIDGSRIGTTKAVPASPSNHADTRTHGKYGVENGDAGGHDPNVGRWPANLILDDESAAMLDGQSGEARSSGIYHKGSQLVGDKVGAASIPIDGLLSASYEDSGGASRFFYTSKASKSDRGQGNIHPTVKPLDLMRYLVNLVSREGQVILDPFAGSGTTLAAAVALGRDTVGIELNPEYVELIEKRMRGVTPSLFAEKA